MDVSERREKKLPCLQGFLHPLNYLACKVSLTPLNYKRVWSDYINILTAQMLP